MLICTGTVFATVSYYTVHTTTASLTVDEAFTVQQKGGSDYYDAASPFVWTVSVHPGETVTQILKVNNAGTVDLTAHVTEVSGNISGVGDYNVPGLGSSADIPLSWTVPVSTAPGIYTFTINISR